MLESSASRIYIGEDFPGWIADLEAVFGMELRGLCDSGVRLPVKFIVKVYTKPTMPQARVVQRKIAEHRLRAGMKTVSNV